MPVVYLLVYFSLELPQLFFFFFLLKNYHNLCTQKITIHVQNDKNTLKKKKKAFYCLGFFSPSLSFEKNTVWVDH